ncbi:hypothetical protein [Breoghania sp.]|uniref:hypothetical protein n=1 Tax=Breoghania sp. TaxID=2065378 RepID=UPI00260B21FE|nr:hypothetical protein [Breoghania sp.]MDJ0930589.1 hypothetical protein [Breoghania sp.]
MGDHAHADFKPGAVLEKCKTGRDPSLVQGVLRIGGEEKDASTDHDQHKYLRGPIQDLLISSEHGIPRNEQQF